MLKDIEDFISEDVGVAAVQDWDEKTDDITYNVYLLNFKETDINGVLVMSKGFGMIDGEEKSSSILRHFLDTVPKHSYCKIEPIQHQLFELNNEYKLTYFANGHLYEKTFLFKPHSIHPNHFKQIPFLKRPGVLIL